MREMLARRHQRIDELVYRLGDANRKVLRGYHRRLDVASARIRHHDIRRKLVAMQHDLDHHTAELAAATRNALLHFRNRWERLHVHLQGLSPVAILDRGYALIFDEGGTLVKDASHVQAGEQITARVAKGRIIADVKRTEP
jgi:exodeoxyribonuclease VII large subunit